MPTSTRLDSDGCFALNPQTRCGERAVSALRKRIAADGSNSHYEGLHACCVQARCRENVDGFWFHATTSSTSIYGGKQPHSRVALTRVFMVSFHPLSKTTQVFAVATWPELSDYLDRSNFCCAN